MLVSEIVVYQFFLVWLWIPYPPQRKKTKKKKRMAASKGA
jgi:preprotein translocase subunit YajC